MPATPLFKKTCPSTKLPPPFLISYSEKGNQNLLPYSLKRWCGGNGDGGGGGSELWYLNSEKENIGSIQCIFQEF